MRITYTNTIDDLIAANLCRYRKDDSVQKVIRIFQAIIPIFIIIAFLGINDGHKVNLTFFIFCLLLMVFWIVGYPKFAEFQWKRSVKKQLANMKITGEKVVTLDEEKVLNESENQSMKETWEKIYKIYVTDTHIFIFFNPLQVSAIPNNAFENDEEKEKFLDYIEEHLVDKDKLELDK